MVNITEENKKIEEYSKNSITNNIDAYKTKREEVIAIRNTLSHENRLEYYRSLMNQEEILDTIFKIIIKRAKQQWYKTTCHPRDLYEWATENDINPNTFILDASLNTVYFQSQDTALVYSLASDLEDK